MSYLELPIKEWVVASMIDLDGIHPNNIQQHVKYSVESMCHILRLTLKTPTWPIQNDTVVASWPATWWDAIKDRLGWKHARKELRINQCLVVPEIPVGLEKHKVFHIYEPLICDES